MSATFWLALAVLQAGNERVPVLRVGETLENQIVDADSLVHTATLDTGFAGVPAVGKSYSIRVAETGSYWIDLRSGLFDAFIVLREETGDVLEEDDDGGIGTHARIVTTLKHGVTYGLDACALLGERGAFELTLSRGVPPALSPDEESAAELDELRRSLALREELRGPEHPDTAASLIALGSRLHELGDDAAARSYLERALAICEKVLGREHPATADALYYLGNVEWADENIDVAQALFSRALGIYEQAHEAHLLDTADCLENLGLLLQERGDLAGARWHLERGLSIREGVRGSEPLDIASCLNDLALVQQSEGDFSAARGDFERALAIRESLLPSEDPDTMGTREDLAILLQQMGDYPAARPLFERALAITERIHGAEHPDTAISLGNLAGLIRDQGDLAAARPLFERSLAIAEKAFGPEHPATATCLDNLAGLLWDQGEPAAAKPLFMRALAIRQRVLGDEHLDTAIGFNNVAESLREEGDTANARPLFERALAIFESELRPGDARLSHIHNNLALLFEQEGDYVEARTHLEQALAIKRITLGADHPEIAESVNNLALLLADQGQTSEAWSLVDRAWNAGLERRRSLVESLSEAEGFRYLSAIRWQLEALLSLAGDLRGEREATYDAVLSWKGEVSRALVASRGDLSLGMDDGRRQQIEELRSVQRGLSALAFQREIRDLVAHEKALADLRRRRNELELELRRSSPANPSLDTSGSALRAKLEPRSAFVDFFVHRVYEPARRTPASPNGQDEWGVQRVSVWITRPDRDGVVHIDLGPAADLEKWVRAFLRDCSVPAGTRAIAAAARGTGATGAAPENGAASKLRALLWEPIAKHLDGVNRIFVSPDGFLGTLPFETLPLENGSFLLEQHAFVYVQSTESLVRSRDESASLDSLLCVGGVDYAQRAELKITEPPGPTPVVATSASGSVASTSSALRGGFGAVWPPLFFTIDESKVVADLHERAFPEGRRLLLQGDAPTEERLKQKLAQHSVLHIATHGFFNPDTLPSLWQAALAETGTADHELREERRQLVGRAPGLLSGLVCAGVDADEQPGHDDGYLTAEEVGWLDLSKVELVVLSACETALGRAESGEGLLGLRRAFEMAGAKTVISSLWSVNDESTSKLMEAFYENLWRKKMGRADALRAAQLEMLAKNRAQYHDALPSTWGAFVLSGEWR